MVINMNTSIEIKNLNHRFGDNKVLNNINLNINSGEIFGLLGPSGAGKTTLINILTGQLNATGGSCHIMGISPTEMTGEHYKQIGIIRFCLYAKSGFGGCRDTCREI